MWVTRWPLPSDLLIMPKLGVSWWCGSSSSGVIIILVLVLHSSLAFTLSDSDDNHKAGLFPNVSLPNSNSSHDNPLNSVAQSIANSTTPGNNQDTNHHHQWGDIKFTGHDFFNCPNTTSNCSDQHDKKLEQILWDIFVDEDEEEESMEADEESSSSETSSSSELIYREDEQGEEKEQASRLKRSVNGTEESGRAARKNISKQGKGKKVLPKKQAPKRVSGVAKYNEYMDVVLKRMNSMIKGKKMDPLMVNLFSGGNPAGPNNQNNNNNNKNKKKRKGAKKGNRARMDLDHEGHGGKGPQGKSEDIEDQEEEDEQLIELDNDHDGGDQDGFGGSQFFRRDVFLGVKHHGSEEDDNVDADDDSSSSGSSSGGRSSSASDKFRAVRALILNGSMQRSAGNVSEASDKLQTRGFDDSAETPKKSGPKGAKNKGDSSNNKKQENSKPKSPKTKKDNNNKNKKKKSKQQATRGILKGLSSLRRSGNVDVIRQSEKVRIVRSKFLLGPVTLEIVPRGGGGNKPATPNKNGSPRNSDDKTKTSDDDKNENARNARKSSSSSSEPAASSPSSKVTAVAHQLKGIIEVRLKKNSPTSIKRLRVFPPSSVKIKSATGSSSSSTTTSSNSSPSSKKQQGSKSKGSSSSTIPRYSRVTPVATHRLRQIASAVVRQADLVKKGDAAAASTSTSSKRKATLT